MSKRKPKTKYVDDGHTVYNMDNVTRPGSWKIPDGNKKHKNVSVSREERRALISAALKAYMPMVLTAVLCFSVVAVLLFLWLK